MTRSITAWRHQGGHPVTPWGSDKGKKTRKNKSTANSSSPAATRGKNS